MSVELTIVVGHALSALDAGALPSALGSEPPLAEAVAAMNRQLWANYAAPIARYHWGPIGDAEEVGALWASHRALEIHNPSGLSLRLGPRLCEIAPVGVRWLTTLTDPPAFAAVRRVGRLLAAILSSPAAIYLPDSSFAVARALDLVHEGASLEELLRWLHDRHGPGAASPEQIFSDDRPTRPDNGYYVDWPGTPTRHDSAG